MWITRSSGLRDLPDLLDAELPDLRLAVLAERELADRGAGQMAPRALGEHRRLGGDVAPGARSSTAARRPCRGPCRRSARRAPAVADDQLRRRGLGQHVGARPPRRGACWKRASAATEITSLPWLRNGGGVGIRSFVRPLGQQVDGLLGDLAEREALARATARGRESGNRSSSGCGRITAPDRLCPPQAFAFSITATGTSPRRSAVSGRRPAAPAGGSRRRARRCRRRRSRRRPRCGRPRRRARGG